MHLHEYEKALFWSNGSWYSSSILRNILISVCALYTRRLRSSYLDYINKRLIFRYISMYGNYDPGISIIDEFDRGWLS